MTYRSQLGQLDTYGWILMRQSEWRCSSGTVLSLTRDMDTYRKELHGTMPLGDGANASFFSCELTGTEMN